MKKIEKTISRRALNFPKNPIRGLETVAAETRRSGVKVIPLNMGAPDTPSPKRVLESGSKYLSESKFVGYGPSSGNTELIESRARFYRNRIGMNIESEGILITAGASEALDLAIYSITDPSDEILTPEPFYPNYNAICYKHGTKLKVIPTDIKDGFHIQRKGETLQETYVRISAMVNPKTRAIMWSSPSNPTGAVYSTEELEVLLRIARDRRLYLIADEVYRMLVFDGGIRCSSGIIRAPSIYDVASQKDQARILCIDSSSKEISFCGGRVGYLLLDPKLTPHILKHASTRACPNIIAQKAVEEIDQIDPEYFLTNQQLLKHRRDLVYSLLTDMKDFGVTVSPNPPEGAFYVPIDLGKGVSAEDFCKWMLTDFPTANGSDETVFLSPMQTKNGGFYLDKEKGTSQVRLAYVREIPELQRAISILKVAIPMYRKSLSLG